MNTIPIPGPDAVRLIDEQKVSSASGEIASFLIDPEKLKGFIISRSPRRFQFHLNRYQLNSDEQDKLAQIFQSSGWKAKIVHGQMTDQDSVYLNLEG